MERALAHANKEDRRNFPGSLTRARLLGFATAAAVFFALVAGLVMWPRPGDAERGAVLSKVRTIGVLPMADLTGSALPEHFKYGLTDELIATLGQVKDLTVKMPQATDPSGQRDRRSLKEIARVLDVDALLETTLSSAPKPGAEENVKVRARLIAAGSQGIVWSDEFERPRGAILELPGMIAATIARSVNAALTPAQTSRLAAPHQTIPAAEDAYLQGRAHLAQYGTNAFDVAVKEFERALQLDSEHAGAHSGAAVAYIRLGLDGGISHARARAASLAHVRSALAIDPDLAEAHATLAHIRFIYDWEWSEAEREFRRSIDLNRNSSYARIFYADDLAAMRRFDESVAQGAIATRLDPESGAAARRYALFLYYKRDFAAAARALDDAQRIEPNHAGLPLLQSRIAEAEGRYDDALALASRALDLSGGGGVPLRVHKIRLQILSGHGADAVEGLQALEREAAAGTAQFTSRDRGYIQLALGNTGKALEFFARAVDERDASVVWLGVDPRLDGLTAEPQIPRASGCDGHPASTLTGRVTLT